MPFADVAALALPAHTTVAPVAATPWETVTVRPGDTLWDLAIAHRSTIQAIVEKNQLSGGGALIQPGQKLLVPGRASSGSTTAPSPAKPAAGATTYVVRAGDTMGGVAQRSGVSLTKLLAANKLSSASLIYVGQKITVPGAGSSAGSTPVPAPTPPSGYQYPSKTAQAVAESTARLAATPPGLVAPPPASCTSVASSSTFIEIDCVGAPKTRSWSAAFDPPASAA